MDSATDRPVSREAGPLVRDVALAEAFAAEEVSVVPSVTQRIDVDGRVEYKSAPPTPRSLLELGFAPTRYQFGEAREDVDFDLELSESETSETTLEAGTTALHQERKLGRSVEATAHLSATLVPTTTPAGVEPARPDER